MPFPSAPIGRNTYYSSAIRGFETNIPKGPASVHVASAVTAPRHMDHIAALLRGIQTHSVERKPVRKPNEPD